MPKRSAELKHRDQSFGRFAETAAEWALRLKGYRIIARRWTCRFGEIDVIARRGDLIIFVEVKARPDRAAALGAITGAKSQRILKTARSWMTAHDGMGRHSYRVDAMIVAPWRWPKQVTDILPLDGP